MKMKECANFESNEYVEKRLENYNNLLKSGILDCIKDKAEPCDDVPDTNVGELISRQAAEQPEKRTEEHTETHACDCISREAAIQAVTHFDDTLKRLYELPSVEPERKTGKWIYTENHCWICSECGKHPLKGTGFTPTLDGMRIQWKFCNMCGAKMEVDG